MSEITIDKTEVIKLCDIKLMSFKDGIEDMSVDSPSPLRNYSKTVMAANKNLPIDSLVSGFEKNPKKCKQKLNMENGSSDEDENKPAKKRIVRVVPKRNKKILSESDDSSSEEEEYKPSKKKIVKVISRAKSSKSKVDSESESEGKYSKSKVDSESESESSEEKTPYEKMIEKKRAEHKALLEELKLNEIKAGLLEAVDGFKQKKQQVKAIKSIKRIQTPKVFEPTRKSKRLANMTPDLSEDALYQKALREAAEEKEKKEATPRISSIMSFKEALYYEECYEGCIKNIICKEVKSDQKFCVYDKPALKNLTLKDSNVAKVTPSRISSAAWCPVEKLIVAAGDKYGSIGIWNVESESEPYLFRIHSSGVTSMQFNPYNYAQVISSSYDGTVRCCDVMKQMFTSVYDRFSEVECTYFDFLSESTCIVSQTNGEIILVDNRSRNKNEKNHVCHQSSIKSVNVHPVNKNIFVTASKGREIHLWDLRKLQEKPIADIVHHKKSINSAFFSPVTGNSLLTTSFDDTLCIFDTTNLTSPIKLKMFTRHNNFTGRWLSVFRATWLPKSDDLFVIGCMSHPRRAQVFNSNMDIVHELQGEHLTAITSVNVFHPFRPVFAGCNSSGRISVFT